MAARVLEVDLGALERGAEACAWAPSDERGRLLAEFGGLALGLAVLLEAEPRDVPAPFVLAVGEAVRAGLPTAARAALLGIAPVSGLYAEGHVGGALGARLARTLDALVLRGRTTLPGAVLVLAPEGRAELVARPALRGLAALEANRRLAAELAPASVLSIGPAGERGSPLANLATGEAPPSFVGRGGLGAALGALGLKAVVVRGEVPAARGGDELRARLLRSPRLAARAEGGTLELVSAAAARGELERAAAQALAAEVEARREERHGCRGCPTPCGWVFERAGGARQGARFGASEALGSDLGLDFAQALELLALCDALGLDAKEVGALLALEVAAGLLPRGARAPLEQHVRTLLEPDAPGARGVAPRARELGREVPLVRGLSVRPARELAERLGQCVASGGTDPMKSFPFLLETASAAALRALLAGQPLPAAALEPRNPLGKGRLVWAHENLIAAVDTTGFCAFSAAGLLSDGLCDLDELAQRILPSALRAPARPAWQAAAPGERLLALGAHVVLARRALAARRGAASELDRPAFARAELALPGMLDEYRALRGLDEHGAPTAQASERFGTPRLLALTQLADGPLEEEAAAGPRRAGRVRLRGAELPEGCALELELPAPLHEVLAALRAEPSLAAGRFGAGRFLPAVFRDGCRLAPAALVHAGDELELLGVIGGG